MLRPTPAFLVFVGDAVQPVAAILIAVVGRTAVDMAYFATARYGVAPVLQRFGIGRLVTGGCLVAARPGDCLRCRSSGRAVR